MGRRTVRPRKPKLTASPRAGSRWGGCWVGQWPLVNAQASTSVCHPPPGPEESARNLLGVWSLPTPSPFPESSGLCLPLLGQLPTGCGPLCIFQKEAGRDCPDWQPTSAPSPFWRSFGFYDYFQYFCWINGPLEGGERKGLLSLSPLASIT